MKHSTTRRLLAFLLTAVLLASLLPALSLTAGARAPQKVNAATADELKSYLESSTAYDITLTKDIDKYIGSTEVWCTVHGTKRLNVNGFDVLLHQDEGKVTSYLFRVAADANLTVYDGKNAGTVAKIHYHAKIVSGNLLGTLAKWRHLFDVYGKLTINNVKCTAGRVDTRWNYSKAQNVSVQTYGSAVIVNGGGYLEVNGGYLTGHTYLPDLHGTPVIKAENGSEVYFNFGEVHGYGQADCFGINSGATVQVASGVFDSSYYSKVMWGTESESNRVTFPGRVGLTSKSLAPKAKSDVTDYFSAASVKVTSPSLSCTIDFPDGAGSVSGNDVYLRLLKSNPKIWAIKPTPYFHTDVDDSPRAEHIFKLLWEVYDGVNFVADTVKDGNFDLNVMTDFPDFTPELGKQYKIRCTIIEAVNYGTHGASCYYYSYSTSGLKVETYFQVVESASAPIIQKNLPSTAVFTPGQRLQLSIRASGDDLRYQWYALDPSRPTRPEAISGQTTSLLSIPSPREALDGAYIYCVVSNEAGSVRSNYCKLAKEQTVITEIPILNLEQPRHGVPLDTDVDIDVPGLTLAYTEWVQLQADYDFTDLSDTAQSSPVAGQQVYLKAAVNYDKTVIMDSAVKATALGKASTVKSNPFEGQMWFYIPFTVVSESALLLDTVELTFGEDGAPEIGKPAPQLTERDKGFTALDASYRLDLDTRYSILSQKWFVDGIEQSNPTMEKDHTYTLKAELRSGDYWTFSYDTAVLVDGEEASITSCLTNIVTGAATAAIELEFDTKEGDPGEDYQEYDLLIEGVQVTSKNRTDVLGNGLFFFDGEKTLAVRGSYTGSTDIITNKGVDGLIIRVEEDSVLSTGKNDQPIALEASAVITGPGKLTLSGGDSGIFVRSKNATLTIRNVNMDVQCRWGIGSTTAANSSKLVIDRANIKVDTDKGAICDFGGGITITNCKILRPEGVGISDDGKSITDAEDAYAKSVEIGAAALLPEVVYTPDSRSVVGGKLTVFIEYMAEASDELMEAYLADEVKYQWYCAGEPIPGATEETLELTGAQKGKSVYVVVSFNGNTIESEYSTVHAPAMPFVDVAEGAYYYDAVLWALNHDPQITNGTDLTHFSPDKTCTRAQVVTFLWRANGCPEPTKTSNHFTDVKADEYYYKAVLWAVEKNITNGTSPTTFSPDKGCTRAQVVTFLWRANGCPEAAHAADYFVDVDYNSYYIKALLWAVDNGITKGTSSNKFSPDSTCTRGQIVTFLYRDMA